MGMMAQMLMMGQGAMSKGMGKGMKGMMFGGQQSQWKQAMDQINKVAPEKKLFISGMPDKAKWKELQAHFKEAGHKPGLVETTRNGQGVVCFQDAEAAAAAREAMDGTTMGDNTIKVDA